MYLETLLGESFKEDMSLEDISAALEALNLQKGDKETSKLKMLLDNGEGVSLLPYFTVAEHIRSGELALLDVADLKIQMYRQIFYHKEKWVTGEMEEFIRLAKEL